MSSEEFKELVRALAATPAKIPGLLENISDEQLRRQGPEGEFSVVESVCHLRDIEAEGYATRIKRILAEDQPQLSDIDGARLAVERNYNKQDVHVALRAFSVARSLNLEVFSNLNSEELSREGTLEGVGKIKLSELLVMMRDHDAGHLKEMSDVRG